MLDSLMNSRKGRLTSMTSRCRLMERPEATTAVAAAASLPSSVTCRTTQTTVSQRANQSAAGPRTNHSHPPPGRPCGRHQTRGSCHRRQSSLKPPIRAKVSSRRRRTCIDAAHYSYKETNSVSRIEHRSKDFHQTHPGLHHLSSPSPTKTSFTVFRSSS